VVHMQQVEVVLVGLEQERGLQFRRVLHTPLRLALGALVQLAIQLQKGQMDQIQFLAPLPLQVVVAVGHFLLVGLEQVQMVVQVVVERIREVLEEPAIHLR